MARPRAIDPEALLAALREVEQWLRDGSLPEPGRATLATAVRLSARALAGRAPGRSVEVRVPPFVAVQCISGPSHRRGTPPNVVETDARTWLLLACGLTTLEAARSAGAIRLSGPRAAHIASSLPLVSLSGGEHA